MTQHDVVVGLDPEQEVRTLLAQIAVAASQVQVASMWRARGPGGRELSLCLQKLQEAEDWARRALPFVSGGAPANLAPHEGEQEEGGSHAARG